MPKQDTIQNLPHKLHACWKDHGIKKSTYTANKTVLNQERLFHCIHSDNSSAQTSSSKFHHDIHSVMFRLCLHPLCNVDDEYVTQQLSGLWISSQSVCFSIPKSWIPWISLLTLPSVRIHIHIHSGVHIHFQIIQLGHDN